MAVDLVVGDVLKLQVYTRDIEQVSVNSFYYRVTAVTTGTPDTQDAAVDFNTAIKPSFVAWITSQAEYRGVVCTDLTQLPLNSGSPLLSASFGSGGAIGAPRQSAPLIKYQTGLAGPKGRGRLYIPFIPVANISAFGIVSSGALPLLVAIQTAMAGFTTITNGGVSATVENVLYHRATKTATKIETYLVDNKIATQKRRGSYGRANTSPL